MTTPRQRIEQLEAQQRQGDSNVTVDRIAAATGIDRDELMTEAERVAGLMPANLTPRDQVRWHARDMGVPEAEI